MTREGDDHMFNEMMRSKYHKYNINVIKWWTLWERKRKYGKRFVKGRDLHEQIWQLALLFGFLGIFEHIKEN